MIGDRFRHALQSPAARQAEFEERARLARIGEVQRASDDLLAAAHELRRSSSPVWVSAAAHFEMASGRTSGCVNVAEFAAWVTAAVRCARAVLLGDRGQS